MTSNDAKPKFQGHVIIQSWISQKRCEMQTQLQWTTNRDLWVSFRMTLSDLWWLSDIFNDSMIRSMHGLCATAELLVTIYFTCGQKPMGTASLVYHMGPSKKLTTQETGGATFCWTRIAVPLPKFWEKLFYFLPNFTDIGQSAVELWPKTIFNMTAVRHLELIF